MGPTPVGESMRCMAAEIRSECLSLKLSMARFDVQWLENENKKLRRRLSCKHRVPPRRLTAPRQGKE